MVAAARQLEIESVQARTEALYREHRTHVAGICRLFLRDQAEAEDATQEVFLSAHRALLGGVVPREPLAWLATIARRECWARGARAGAAALRPEDVADVSNGDVENLALREAEVAALWLAIADLPGPQREALLLREIRGLSYLQLGEALAVSTPTARSLLARARQKVRLRVQDLHTAVGGVPLVETLARLIASGLNPAAPAARVAALGLVAGGAIIAPSALEHHVRRPVALAVPQASRPAKPVSRPAVKPKLRVAAPAQPLRHVVTTAPTRPVAVFVPRQELHHAPARLHVEIHHGGGGGRTVVHSETPSGRSGGEGKTATPPTTGATAPVSSSGGQDGGDAGGITSQSRGSGDVGNSHDGGGSGDGGGSADVGGSGDGGGGGSGGAGG